MVIVSFMNGMFKHRIVMRYLISTFIILLVMFFTLNSVTANTPLFKSALSDFNVLNSVFKVLNYVNYTVTYSVDLFIPANSRVELRVAVPPNFPPYQVASLFNSSHPISGILVDECGNEVAVVQLPQSFTAQKLRVSITYMVTIFQVNCSIDPSNIGIYNTSLKEYLLYTKPERYIECDDPNIIGKAREIVGLESNVYHAVYKLFMWVYKNIKYEYEHEVRGALLTLLRGSGACDEHAYLLTALCRAVGIPSRCVNGYGFHLNDTLTGSFTMREGHAWVEILLPNYGWIFVDPTWGLFADSDVLHVSFRRGVESSLLDAGLYCIRYYGSAPRILGSELKVSVIPVDSDGDGLTNLEEYKFKTNAFNVDTDADGLMDGEEMKLYNTNPLKADTDDDGLNDYVELKVYHTDPLTRDTDNDELTDHEEISLFKTNPLLADSDGDGLSDGFEVKISKTNPLNPDSDGDGLNDYLEFMILRSNPLSYDSDGDLWPDYIEYIFSSLIIFNLNNFFLPNFDIIGLIFIIVVVSVAFRSKC